MKKLALLLTLPLIGCGLAADMKSESEMNESKARYKACIDRGASCEKERLTYEADLKSYNARTMRGW